MSTKVQELEEEIQILTNKLNQKKPEPVTFDDPVEFKEDLPRDPDLWILKSGDGAAAAVVTHPFQIVITESDANSVKYKIRYGNVNNRAPLIGGNFLLPNLDDSPEASAALGDGEALTIYLQTEIDLDTFEFDSTPTINQTTGNRPAFTETDGSVVIGFIIRDADGNLTINQQVTGNLLYYYGGWVLHQYVY